MDIFSSIKIIKETTDFLVIIKPSGLIVHPNAHQKNSTLVDWFLSKYPDLKNIGEDKLRPGIVHRLDQAVSGLMVIAKTDQMFFHLKKQFQERKVGKKYYGLVFGRPSPEQGEISLSLGRSKSEPNKMKVKHDQSGKSCLTLYKTIKKYSGKSLLDIEIKTGRTHQIRAHFKGIGHSLVGDRLYKSKGTKSDLDRIFLHSYYLGFFDLDNKRQEFNISLPNSLEKYLKSLNNS